MSYLILGQCQFFLEILLFLLLRRLLSPFLLLRPIDIEFESQTSRDGPSPLRLIDKHFHLQLKRKCKEINKGMSLTFVVNYNEILVLVMDTTGKVRDPFAHFGTVGHRNILRMNATNQALIHTYSLGQKSEGKASQKKPSQLLLIRLFLYPSCCGYRWLWKQF